MSNVEKVEAPVLAVAVAPRRFQFRLIHLLVAMGLVCVALAVIVPVYRLAKHRAERLESANNLKQILLAMHNYHDVVGTFPPAYQCDASGKPAHSWRLLIIPFMESSDFYDRYSFAEPWNGPNNSKLGQLKSGLFRSPSDLASAANATSYVAIVGPNTSWPGEQSTRIAQILDGTSNTIMVVEISHSDIHWMEPRDLPIDELEAWLDPQHKPRLGGEIEGGFVAYADGSVHYLPRGVTVERLRALLTPAGNDTEVSRAWEEF